MNEKILILDNYDSFNYNLIPLIKMFYNYKVYVSTISDVRLEEIYSYNRILLSPGPGFPSEAPIINPLIKSYATIKSVLGVCLGQQSIVDVFGGKLIRPQNVYHGISSKITIVDNEEKIFDNLPTYLKVGRYHSWIVSECNFPLDFKITARGLHGEIMALRHKTYDLVGVQFHPESICTPKGVHIIYNWLNLPKAK